MKNTYPPLYSKEVNNKIQSGYFLRREARLAKEEAERQKNAPATDADHCCIL
jgi:hypothetical protein